MVIKQNLGGKWQMKRLMDSEWIEATVPGSVFGDLLKAGRIEDPFYRDNEERAGAIMEEDYVYARIVPIRSELLGLDRLLLVFEGLDTLADIRFNGVLLGKTNNMHRKYEFDVSALAVEGDNLLEVKFGSPLAYLKEKNEANPVWGPAETLPGFPHLRKAHYMFGWDWGPVIPDAGIWRDVYLLGASRAMLEDVLVRQSHAEGEATVRVGVSIANWTGNPLELRVGLTDPDGRTVSLAALTAESDSAEAELKVGDPKLWWPNGFGEQPLYRLTVGLFEGEGEALDERSLTIGLRTLAVRQEPDEWGRSFEFVANGVPMFAMGANYVPEDNLIGRASPERTEKLLRAAAEANFNCVRVWGGGYYPDDSFYELCDRYGLVVWQDFMFACGVYTLDDEFSGTVRAEAIDNVRRLRHHACIGLWCGNNEMEWGWAEWAFPKPDERREDYLKLFERLLADVVAEYDPDRLYWPASPSSGGGFDDPNDQNRGDVHYWEVWHGLKPFSDYRNYHFRFLSEFGFQSFPALKTIETFALQEDRNVFSHVMERHQKNGAANGKILHYLSQTYLYPKDFDSLLYASQLLQAEAIRYGVEHLRRNRGRCMGALYWQLNDCWPVASWSSIDYYGRPKALHYFARRFFAPVMLSAVYEKGLTEASLHVANETRRTVRCTVRWKLCNEAGIVREGAATVDIEALTSVLAAVVPLDGFDDRGDYLAYSLFVGEEEVGTDALLFVPAKHFRFREPRIGLELEETADEFRIVLSTDRLAKNVELGFADADATFSDNYFDLIPGRTKTVSVKKESAFDISYANLREKLTVRSVSDIA